MKQKITTGEQVCAYSGLPSPAAYESERLTYVEWMHKIQSCYRAPSLLQKGIEHLAKELEYKLPEGVKKR